MDNVDNWFYRIKGYSIEGPKVLFILHNFWSFYTITAFLVNVRNDLKHFKHIEWLM